MIVVVSEETAHAVMALCIHAECCPEETVPLKVGGMTAFWTGIGELLAEIHFEYPEVWGHYALPKGFRRAAAGAILKRRCYLFETEHPNSVAQVTIHPKDVIGESFTVVVMLAGVERDERVCDDCTDFDLAIANDPDMQEIYVNVLEIPNSSPEALAGFVKGVHSES